MRPTRLAATLLLPLALLGAAGCTDDGAAAPAVPAAAPSAGGTPPPAEVPSPAGPAEATSLAALPTGAAAGTAVLAYTGVGEVREPFTGECTRDGDTTRIAGSADTARITLTVAPQGARVVLEDVGFSATSDLATGRYDVAGRHLSLAAPLIAGGQQAGSIELEVDCGS